MFLYSLDGDALFGPFINEVDAGLALVERLKTMPEVKVAAIMDDVANTQTEYAIERSRDFIDDYRLIITLTEV
jgi:hypothetical protein